jgi:hypothetical protein
MCKKLIQGLFGGAPEAPKPMAVIQPTDTTGGREDSGIVKTTGDNAITSTIGKGKKKREDQGVPGLGL